MGRAETVHFELKRYQNGSRLFANDLVAQLPGLLITQFAVLEGESLGRTTGKVGLRFDFVDDWYCVLVFLDQNMRPTGHYRGLVQTPLKNEDGLWKGSDLLLGLEVSPDGDYYVTGEEDFCAAVEQGWMRVYAAARAREALRKLCSMLDEGRLPQEVMDAVGGGP